MRKHLMCLFFFCCLSMGAWGQCIITGPASVCIGATINLTCPCVGTWSSSSTAIATVSGGGVVTGVSGGSVTITLTVGGIPYTKLIAVNNAPILGASFVCVGSTTITLTDATPGGTWSSSSSGLATVGSTGIVTGVSPGTVTISYITSCGSTTKTISVVPVCLCPSTTTPIQIGASGTFTSGEMGMLALGGVFFITNNVTCTSTFTMHNCIISMASGTNITINGSAGTTVTVEGSHLFCCSSMWTGFIVSPANRLVLQKVTGGITTLIEDAVTAVDITNPVTPTGYATSSGTGSPLILYCNGAAFNKNTTGIAITNYTPISGIAQLTDADNTPSYPFYIADAVFTSRELTSYSPGSGWPFSWPINNGAGGIAGLKDGGTPATVYDPPYNMDISTLVWYNFVNCNNGSAAQTGIDLKTVGNTTGTRTSAVYKGVYVGLANNSSTDMVLFDHLNYGIKATGSNLTVRNCTFMHMKTNSSFSVGGGYGVYSDKSTSLSNLKLHICGTATTSLNYTANFFYDCATAVRSINLAYTKSTYAQLFGSPSSPCNHAATSAFGPQAAKGFDIISNHFYNMQLRNNIITNITGGINIVTNAGCDTAGEINVSYNTIQAMTTGAAPSGGQYVLKAITVTNLTIPISSTLAVDTFSYINIDNNELKYVYNGIYVQGKNSLFQKITTSANTVQLTTDVATLGGYHQYGIEHANTTKGYIYNNTVVGLGYNTPPISTSSYPASTVRMMEGIVSSATTTGYTECNTVHDINTGFFFTGNCLNEDWINNTMTNNQFGYVLNGTIGVQPKYTPLPIYSCGNAWTTASGFSWGSGSTAPYQTYAYGGGMAVNSPIIVLSTVSNQVPTANYSTPFVLGVYYAPSTTWAPGSSSTSTTLYTGGQSFNVSCSSYLPPTAPAMFMRTTTADTVIPDSRMFTDVVTGQLATDTGTYAAAKKWIAQKLVYDAIMEDTTIMDSSTALVHFRGMANDRSRFHWLLQLNNSLAAGDTIGALTLLAYNVDSLAHNGTDTATGAQLADDTSANTVVQNYIDYYRLLTGYLRDTLSGSDTALLITLANKCPSVDGPIIHNARALYSIVVDDTLVFGTGDCETMSDTSSKGAHSASTASQVYSLYPNPNNGHLTLLQSQADDNPISVSIWNTTGAIVYTGKLQFKGYKARIDLDHLPSGIYLLRAIDDKGRGSTIKFTLVHP